MVDVIELAAQTRQARGKQVKAVRAEGNVPAVIYGHGVEAQPLSVGQRSITKVFADAGSNKMVALSIDDGKPYNVMIQDVQTDSRSGQIIHADFYKVKMNEKIKAEIPLHVIGESTAVYKLEGSLIQGLSTVEVEALPANLPENIEVDISVLDDFDKTIHVSDLTIPGNVELLTDTAELVAKVEPPRSDEELEDLDAPVVDEVAGEEGDAAEDNSEEKTEDSKEAAAE
jgi:large subunit ribosomal protein L25